MACLDFFWCSGVWDEGVPVDRFEISQAGKVRYNFHKNGFLYPSLSVFPTYQIRSFFRKVLAFFILYFGYCQWEKEDDKSLLTLHAPTQQLVALPAHYTKLNSLNAVRSQDSKTEAIKT